MALIRNSAERSIYLIEFKPSVSHPTTFKLKIYFPTRNSYTTLFSNDLDTGISNGGAIFCRSPDSSMDLSTACTLTHGNQDSS